MAGMKRRRTSRLEPERRRNGDAAVPADRPSGPDERAPMPLSEAYRRLALGLAQMVLAGATVVALLGGSRIEIVAALALGTTVLSGLSVARWGGFWRRR